MYNNRFKRKGRFSFFMPALLLIPLLWLLLSAVVMMLWNAILPSLLHTNRITYWQAAGLFLLCKILFGGFRRMPGRRPPERPFGNMREKWKGMSAEEREKFRSEWRNRCRPPQKPE